MIINTYPTKLYGIDCELKLTSYEAEDRKQWKVLFDYWKTLTNGMKKFGARGVNIPEGITEVAFCLFSDSKRFVSVVRGGKSASFDTFNVKTNRAEQVKACSVKKDMTSFGPKSKWDDLYFLDFYNNGELDGSFDVYLIPNDLIKKTMVNKEKSFVEFQRVGKRPRFSIKEKIIQEQNLDPIAKNVRVWI